MHHYLSLLKLVLYDIILINKTEYKVYKHRYNIIVFDVMFLFDFVRYL